MNIEHTEPHKQYDISVKCLLTIRDELTQMLQAVLMSHTET